MGSRVVAIACTDDKHIKIYGYGTYIGEEIPPPGIKCLGVDLNEMGLSNSRIDLDNGKTVWGCECWWGCIGSKSIEQLLSDGRKIVEIDIDESRKPPEFHTFDLKLT